MCGIVGFYKRKVSGNIMENLVRMRDSMTHRGPDDEGLWLSASKQVGLAHRRLAIIDLSPGGHQPMADHSGRYWIVFNGELYNHSDLRLELEDKGHQFLSRSDTEVLLESFKEWGYSCVNKFNGMFSFCIFDSAEQIFFAARDRAGEKPFYYSSLNGDFLFASELKAIMADGDFKRIVDRDQLNSYFTFGYVPSPGSILKNVNKLPEGHALIFDIRQSHVKTWEYWDVAVPGNSVLHADPEELVSELESLLSDAISRQLVADVPVGVLLSGGIDSSLVTALAARTSSKKVKTFTISFPGQGHYDESRYAKIVSDYFDTEHYELPAEPATYELLPLLAKQYDEPIADSSIIPTYLVTNLVRKNATVALGGDGGDELFGGYQHHFQIPQKNKVLQYFPGFLYKGLGIAAGQILPVGFKGRNFLTSYFTDFNSSVALVNVFFDAVSREKLFSRDFRNSLVIGKPETGKANFIKGLTGFTPMQKVLYADLKTQLRDGYLVKVDRASMLNSLEMRSPWLDYRMIEFAYQKVPDNLKADKYQKKILPKLLAKKLLPQQLDLQRKQGFSIPLDAWFKGEWGKYIEQVIMDSDSQFFNKNELRKIINGQKAGRCNMNRLFALTMFELWRREYKPVL